MRRFRYPDDARHTTPRVLATLAEARPGLELVVAEDGRATVTELVDAVVQVSGRLSAAGLGSGDRVGILLPNGLRWLVAAFACHEVGLVAVPMNTWHRRQELGHVLERSGTRLLLAQEAIFGTDYGSLLAELGVLDRGAAERLCDLGTWFWPPGQWGPDGAPELPPAGAGRGEAPEVVVCEDDVAYLLFTSGSTVLPKAVPLRHGDVLRNGAAIADRLGAFEGDRLWTASPFFFSFGPANAVPVSLTRAVTLCVQERFEPTTSLRFLVDERCTIYYGQPPHTRGLLAHPEFNQRDVALLRTGVGPMSAEDKRLARHELGVDGIVAAYGMTEASTLVCMTDPTDPDDVLAGCQGTVLRGQELRVVDEAGRPCATGEAGDVEVRGRVMPGYWVADPSTPSPFTPDGWFRTGDRGALDDAGRFTFLGRRSEIIKTKGILVSPSEVEAVLLGHSAVAQAFVFGVPDDVAGEVTAAVVVPRGATPAACRASGLDEELRAYVRAQVASYKAPALVRFVGDDELPLTSTGKVDRKAIRALSSP